MQNRATRQNTFNIGQVRLSLNLALGCPHQPTYSLRVSAAREPSTPTHHINKKESKQACNRRFLDLPLTPIVQLSTLSSLSLKTILSFSLFKEISKPHIVIDQRQHATGVYSSSCAASILSRGQRSPSSANKLSF